jgi:hypothetical protein
MLIGIEIVNLTVTQTGTLQKSERAEIQRRTVHYERKNEKNETASTRAKNNLVLVLVFLFYLFYPPSFCWQCHGGTMVGPSIKSMIN